MLAVDRVSHPVIGGEWFNLKWLKLRLDILHKMKYWLHFHLVDSLEFCALQILILMVIMVHSYDLIHYLRLRLISASRHNIIAHTI